MIIMTSHRFGISATRALKHAKFLQKALPQVVPDPEPQEGFQSIISADVLALSRTDDMIATGRLSPQVAERLREVELPAIQSGVVNPLFNGTIFFARLVFTVQSQNNALVSVSAADVATAIDYAARAVVPISQYAEQYGPNGVTVSPTAIEFEVTLSAASGTSYNNAMLESWVNEIVSQNNLPSSACVAVLNPRGLDNTDALRSSGFGGYHLRANRPYLFVNVNGEGLTVADRGWAYAGSLSHEIAEMVVDPNADSSNPEVCDPCGPNCASTYIDYFDASQNYIETSQIPPYDPGAPVYDFYLNGIVTPQWAKPCPITVPKIACAYSPIFQTDRSSQGTSEGSFSVVVGTRTDGRPFYNYWQLGQGGHGWTELSDGLTDLPPAAALVGTDVNGDPVSPPYLFVIAKGQGADSTLYLNQLSLGQGQVGWQPIDGLQTDVGAGASAADCVTALVAVEAGTGRVFYNWWRLGEGGQGWTELPGLLTDTAPAAALVGTDVNGDPVSPPYLFVIAKGQGVDSTLYLNQLSLGQGQVGWQPIDGLQTDVGAGASTAGAVTALVTVEAGTGRVFYNWWRLGEGGQGWTELPGLLTDTAPAAALVGTDVNGNPVSPPYLFVIAKGQGSDPTLYLNQLSLGQGQVGWQPVAPDYGT
ncbi:hypothetical protein WK62_31120 [Burkholderia ubonensis]|nr:hypothetical protein WK62_31120 [Burkholderia ubonensis]